MQRVDNWVTRFEETFLALLLAAMTIISFTQVVARYGFNTGWGGALELTRILFAWLILFGMSYGVKIGSHLGVDAFIRLLPQKAFRVVAVFGAFCGVLYALILLYAGWLSWLGIDVNTSFRQTGALGYWHFMFQRGFGLDDLRYPELIQEIFGTQDRVQRWIAYIMLPIGLALFGFRCLQAMIAIIKGERETMIAAHEAEELVAEHKDELKD
ncbi:TRAP transporter small permease subunit [Stappia sp. GBMRC 2046]|uniref:TRAP transporter small permease protein n=1 Tax=Stappia sediminis TaxID=2692190 RepID=A0A7X3LU96_9HYPH|nr:TRAP transporter small permease [Stappia sediminis]MXN65240.1 TRAP transporter small permease subunit [Stappia sediminis]